MSEQILNLTRHDVTKEQKTADIVDPNEDLKEKIVERLTFDERPSYGQIKDRAGSLSNIARTWFGKRSEDSHKDKKVMIGGAPFLIPILVKMLIRNDLTPVFSFSKREATEKEVNGEVVKEIKFVFDGLVPYWRFGVGYIDHDPEEHSTEKSPHTGKNHDWRGL